MLCCTSVFGCLFDVEVVDCCVRIVTVVHVKSPQTRQGILSLNTQLLKTLHLCKIILWSISEPMHWFTFEFIIFSLCVGIMHPIFSSSFYYKCIRCICSPHTIYYTIIYTESYSTLPGVHCSLELEINFLEYVWIFWAKKNKFYFK